MSALSYELVRDVIADEIADVGAGCIARVARTASTPATWRMVSADLARWQHPSCPEGWADVLSHAARAMCWAKGGPEGAVAFLDDFCGERTFVVALEPEAITHSAEAQA